ncbi:hypothetical protein GLYMA_13G052251v4 [Glycine max]|nr:hypothetical protein GLYMA_13G052251v4 [Glycine max]
MVNSNSHSPHGIQYLVFIAPISLSLATFFLADMATLYSKHFLLEFHFIPHKSLCILDFTRTYPLCKNPFFHFSSFILWTPYIHWKDRCFHKHIPKTKVLKFENSLSFINLQCTNNSLCFLLILLLQIFEAMPKSDILHSSRDQAIYCLPLGLDVSLLVSNTWEGIEVIEQCLQ